MRTYDVNTTPYGWHLDDGGYTSDGDLGHMIIEASGTCYLWNSVPTPYVYTDYPLIYLSCTYTNADTISMQLRNTDATYFIIETIAIG